MSGRINYSNLSDSLKEHLNGLGLTEEQVNELIENALVEINEKDVEQDEVVNGLVDKVGELNGLMTEEKGDLVGAINELFQSANNGKELIANAIGEPVSADDTFSAMSNDINGLLATFKTNMMNNGITVESNDKFKSLIDKIATMVEEGSGKGIQFAEGTFNITIVNNYNYDIVIDTNLDFNPTLLFLTCGPNVICSNIHNSQNNMPYFGGNTSAVYIYSFDSSSIILRGMTYKDAHNVSRTGTWYAIGVGEEDTTLRDSLASILQEEGVSVTNEDDMASLISKVDEEFSDKNTEIASKVTPAGNAVASNVLSGKTFINSTGQLVTGTMANMSTHTQVADYVAWNTQSIYLGIPAGAYINASSTGYPEVYIEKTRLDSNLVPENIVSGKSICGVNGTATVSNANVCFIYNLGTDYLTGGWYIYSQQQNASLSMPATAGYLTFKNVSSKDFNCYGEYRTVNSIDMSKYNRLYIFYVSTRMHYIKTSDGTINNLDASSGVGLKVIDISNVKSSVQLGFNINGYGASNSVHVQISKIWMEV